MLYAVTGVVLARMLSQEDFGLVGAVLVFQAFALLIIDGGFSYAIMQRKEPSQLDYSSVFWFNIGISVLLYIILYLCAPLIALCFQNDPRLIPLSRVMFLSLILNASASAQIYRQMKNMEVRIVAVANSISLAAGGITGIALALTGFGAWAIVWQSIASSAVKSLVMWTSTHWHPSCSFSWQSLRSYMGTGARMMLTSFLNTVFLNIYSFFIGNRAGLSSLGYYTQSDKWSKMGVMSLSQVLTSSFLPALSKVQDDTQRFTAMVQKMNRFTAYFLFPCLLGLCLMATPIFHLLFGTKWDPSILLFQLLLVRGIFVVLNSLFSNYILVKGHSGTLVRLEVIRDAAALAALFITLPSLAIELPTDPVYGIRILLIGQLIATVLAWCVTLYYTVRLTAIPVRTYLANMAPYLIETLAILPLMWLGSLLSPVPILTLIIEAAIGLSLYLAVNAVLNSTIQKEIINQVRGR